MLELHELSVAQSVVKRVIEYKNKKNLGKVTKIMIEIGEYSFLNEEQLKFGINAMIEDTELSNVNIKITEKKGRIRCSECGYEGEPDTELSEEEEEKYHLNKSLLSFKCPKCSSKNTKIISGRDVNLKGIEVEEE